MLVYGKNSCEEILKQGKDIKRVYLERNFKDKVITSLIEKLKIKPVFLTKYELDEMTLGNHQGVVIDVLEFKYADIDEIIKENYTTHECTCLKKIQNPYKVLLALQGNFLEVRGEDQVLGELVRWNT